METRKIVENVNIPFVIFSTQKYNNNLFLLRGWNPLDSNSVKKEIANYVSGVRLHMIAKDSFKHSYA
jgi:hypothetical protein